ncbi:MAG: hypothetical protein LBL20_04800 [Treponema sp.]|jgi:phenylpyruvate tautomerase PptA (4-oxalocrotonate tautomerase family)|nr:hypothetical protein [Treponema sp.]
MADLAEYRTKMTEALSTRADKLEREEMPKLKEGFRTFHTAFYSIYSLLLKRKLIREDPYKDEAKIAEIEVPETGVFPENERADQMGLRLAAFDNQLDFIVNFYQFTLDNFSLDKIKRILGLIKYIDWARFVTDASANTNTNNMVELVNQAKSQKDPLSITILGDSLTNLSKSTGIIMALLKEISDYDREAFKAEIREKATSSMPAETPPQAQAIRKKYAAAAPGKPFYNELAEEIIREDYTKEGAAIRERILKQFSVSIEKPKENKPEVSYKSFLIEGLFAVGSISAMLTDIIPKLDENAEILENKHKSLFQKLKELLHQMLNKDPEAIIYIIEYVDPVRQVQIKEKLNFTTFHAELERKAKVLFNVSTKGRAVSKLEGMEETQLLGRLAKNSRDIQTIHKLLNSLDEYFKAAADQEDRGKIRGIKPELSTMKNALIRANQKRYEYSAQKEEEEQFKKLGITN